MPKQSEVRLLMSCLGTSIGAVFTQSSLTHWFDRPSFLINADCLFDFLGQPVGSVFDEVFQTPPVDGIDLLPKKAGIYAMLNRITRKWNIGQSQDIRLRCQLHRAQLRARTAPNLRIRRDVEKHGADAFFFLALELVTDRSGSDLKHKLDQLEIWWVGQLQAHDEQHGYVLEAGHCRTKGSRFRDRETKLMRINSCKYQLLPGVDLHDPIHPVLLASWVPGS